MTDLLKVTASPELTAPASSCKGQDDAPDSDKRLHPRYRCDGYAEVFLPQGGLLFRGRILNLSQTGCYIETALLDLERGTQIEVYFVTNQLQFRVLGKIAALRRKRGAGIAFVNVNSRRALQIEMLVDELASKSS